MNLQGIRKIVYFVIGPFSERDHSRFGINIFEKFGFDVEVWDFSPLLYPRDQACTQTFDTINYSKLRIFSNRGELLNAMSLLSAKDCFVICFVPYAIKTYFIFRKLSVKKVQYSVFMANAIPLTACSSYNINDIVKNISFKEVADKIRNLTVAKILEFIFFKLNLKLLRIVPATLRLAGGRRSAVVAKFPVNSHTQTLWIHTLDYDIYLDELSNVSFEDPRQAVFLDEYMPFHSAYQYLGAKPFITNPVEYYGFLCSFFKFLENTYGLHIVIASHPRAHYEKHEDYFQGRPVIKGQTVRLIRNSAFAISHASTSLNYAVLFRKPIIFVTTDKLDISPEGVWIHNIASFFNKRVYNLNKFDGIDLEAELKINQKLYDNYKNDYIKKTGSEELAFWQIVAKRIKEL